MFDLNKVVDELRKGKHPEDQIKQYFNYCNELLNKTKKGGAKQNPWMGYKTDNDLVNYFEKVKIDGLCIDGINITIQSTGISYNYVAYKNKMLQVYPESKIDIQLAFKDDVYQFKKESGRVIYVHTFADPFNQKSENIKGVYCVIKNKRGEFLTTLTRDEILKHKKVAKTDYIWNNWFNEMSLKTVIKKACKLHFLDIFQNIETIDNENYDLEKLREPAQPQRTASITPPIASISKEKVDKLFVLLVKLNKSTKKFLDYASKKFNKSLKKLEDLNDEEYNIIMELFKK